VLVEGHVLDDGAHGIDRLILFDPFLVQALDDVKQGLVRPALE
jgi:hypothetical protein